MQTIQIPVGYGELVDKLTILQIKAQKISDPQKVASVQAELSALQHVWRQRFGHEFGAVTELAARLGAVNAALWEIEDDIRACERAKRFDDAFVRLARAVYVTNDQRAAIKREIDELLGSPLRQEKSYAPYDAEPRVG